jgi:hypothetical protein
MGWTQDLALGKKYELVFFENEMDDEEIYQSEGLCKGWDLETFTGVRYEVKACRKWRFTGNILVEFACSGKDSGISTTTSHEWAFYQLGINDDWIKVIIIPTKIIKEMIRVKAYDKFVYGAEYKMSDFFLFKESVILSKYKEHIKISKNPNYKNYHQSTLMA